MRNISRLAALLLVCYPLLALAQNAAAQPVAKTPASDQNSILNLYDAFGDQKHVTILDLGCSALVHHNDKTILFDAGNSADGFALNVKARVWTSSRWISPCSLSANDWTEGRMGTRSRTRRSAPTLHRYHISISSHDRSSWCTALPT